MFRRYSESRYVAYASSYFNVMMIIVGIVKCKAITGDVTITFIR